MLNRVDRALRIAGHFISGLLALVIWAVAWCALAILALLAGFIAVIAMHMLTDNMLLAVAAFFAGSTLIGLFFSIYVWGPYIGPAVLGVLKAVTERKFYL